MTDNSGGSARPARFGPLGWLVAAAAVIAVVVVALWVTGALEEDVPPPATPEDPEPLLQEEGVLSVEEMTENPDQWLGQRVTLAGQLSAGLPDDPALALLESFQDPQHGIILATDGQPLGAFPEVARARVEGTLTRFDFDEIGDRLLVEPNEGLFDEYVGELTLLVDDVHLFLAGRPAGTIMTGMEGWTVTLTAHVDEVLAGRLFTVEDGVVAVLAPEAADVEPGALLDITGTVAIFQGEVMEPDLVADLSDEELEQLEGLPLLIAEEIEPLDNLDASGN